MHTKQYLLDPFQINTWLNKFIDEETPLAIDIETKGLKHTNAGILTISLAWSQDEGIAFPVDLNLQASFIRSMLKEFFIAFKGKAIYHRASFDVYIIIYELFMDSLVDLKGMNYGLEVMLRNWDDTQYIAYLATNSCKRHKTDLKTLAKPFLGDYSKEVKDDMSNVASIPPKKLLKYNLDDTRATWYVFNTYYPIMVADNQEDVYINIFKRGMANIIQMQLTGLPLNMAEVSNLENIIEPSRKALINSLQSFPDVQRLCHELKQQIVLTKNLAYKKKIITTHDVDLYFNPKSPKQLSKMLYSPSFFNLPVLDKTAAGLPSTSTKTLTKLQNLVSEPEHIEFINQLLDFKSSQKISDTFLPAMLASHDSGQGYNLMFGSFNSTGTVSGRLSSSDVNLQQIPSTGTVWAKAVKTCFALPPDKILCGVDFDSLEDKISALWTKDPNKLKIYTDGFDGHCLRAHAYFGDQMIFIDPNDVIAINSIAHLYPDLRQQSKAPTFLLTYDGTYRGLVKNCGFPEDVAIRIWNVYHQLFEASDKAVQAKMEQACKDGYVTLAFGLRLRTPILATTMYGSNNIPYLAQKEMRTAANALGQSWGLLNTRAAAEFMEKVRLSRYSNRISIAAQIHDSIYLIVDNNIEVIMYVNEHLIKAIQWQEDPIIAHDDVKLSGKLAVYPTSWNDEIIIPNEATQKEILQLCPSIRKH